MKKILTLLFFVIVYPAYAVDILPNIIGFNLDANVAARNGTIYIVDTLSGGTDSPSCSGGVCTSVSLRSALAASGPRYILFAVSGVIELTSGLSIPNGRGNVWVAGQTAPSPGITIHSNSCFDAPMLLIQANDVVVQHIRFRVGDTGCSSSVGNKDGISIQNSGWNGSYTVNDVVIDHCSISWGIDENGTTWYNPVSRVVWSNNIVAEGLSNSYSSEGEHSKGILVGDYNDSIVIYRNLFSNNYKRNPISKGATPNILIANNLVYNFGYYGTHLITPISEGRGDYDVDVIDNFYIRGPDSSTLYISSCQSNPGSTYYLSGNTGKNGGTIITSQSSLFTRECASNSSTQVFSSTLTTSIDGTYDPYTYQELATELTQTVGAWASIRDATDQRQIDQVASAYTGTYGTGNIIDDQDSVNHTLLTTQNNVTPSVPSNPHDDDDGDGYDNIEEWLHSLDLVAQGVDEEPTPAAPGKPRVITIW